MRYSTPLQDFIKTSLCHCQISSPEQSLCCCFISYWHQPNRPSSFSQHSPNQKTPQISMYRLHMLYQYKNIQKLYRSQLSRSK